jgi:hypothetical protein
MSGWKPVSGWWIGCLAIRGQWHSLAHKRGIHMFCFASRFVFHIAWSRFFIIGQSPFLWRLEDNGLSLQLVLSMHRTYRSATTPPLASTATPLGEGVLNPYVEGAIFLMICQAVPVDPMWERGDVPHLAYQGEWTAHLISQHGWLIIILLRAKERYWQSSNCNSKVQLYTLVFFVLPMHYYCFLFCSFYLPALNPLAFIFFHIKLVGFPSWKSGYHGSNFCVYYHYKYMQE